MRLHELSDWRECLEGIRSLVDYSTFRARFEGRDEVYDEEDDGDGNIEIIADVSNEIDDLIAEGMLHAVVSLPPEEAGQHLVQFADELLSLRPGTDVEPQDGEAAESYRELFELLEETKLGLPALVETFRLYSQGQYDPCGKGSLDLLKEARQILRKDEQAALRLVGEVGCLYLRGLEDGDFYEGVALHPMGEPLSHWVEALSSIADSISEQIDEYPLGEVELARDQWRNPDDSERIEYKRGKLDRLGIAEPDLQRLLLPLYKASDSDLSPAEKSAITAAGPRVASGLSAIAGDRESVLQCSVSGGEAAIRAVNLLGELRAAEAVPVLLRILETNEWDTIVHDNALQVLQDEMPDLAFDAALEIFDRTEDVYLKSEMAGIIANGGKGKPEVYRRLIKFFRKAKDQQGILAVYLANFGDPRALPELHEAFRRNRDQMARNEIAEAITRLGGELDTGERRELQPAPATQQRSSTAYTKPEPVRVTKVGRNEPCPCGSGKKYKKCCLR